MIRTLPRIRSYVLLAGMYGLLCCGCGGQADKPPAASIPTTAKGSSADTGNASAVEPVQLTGTSAAATVPNPTVETHRPEVLITTSMGDIRIRLNPDKAPRTVENFIYNYVERGFYDNTIIHYVDAGFMIAAGGYDAQFKFKQPRTPILCEANNGLLNKKGTVAMAHHPDQVNSATSQFFINLADNPGLDYRPDDEGQVNGYCVFGEVIDGMDVIEDIAAVAVQDRDQFPKTPVEPVLIKSAQRIK